MDVVGVVSMPTGETAVDESGVQYPLYAPLPGFHINLSHLLMELIEWEIPRPTSPMRVFASAEPKPARVPTEVARWQAKIVLQRAGHWDSLGGMLEVLPPGDDAELLRAAMNETLNWRRDSPTLAGVATALGRSPETVDALFIEAANINL